MRQLNETGKKILFVVDNKRLEGTLTDGDIRRYLLSGGALADGVCNAANCHPQTAANHKQAGIMLRTSGQTAIPVVDTDRTLNCRSRLSSWRAARGRGSTHIRECSPNH